MAKKIMFQLKGVQHVNVVVADQVERDGPFWLVKKGASTVAQFKEAEVQAWWIDED